MLKEYVYKYWLLGLLYIIASQASAQVYGVVTDSLTNETLPYISISHNKEGIAITDNSGYYKINIKPEYESLTFSAVGYKTKTIKLIPGKTKKLDIQLVPDNILLDEMVVRPKKERYRKKDNPAVIMMRKVIAAKKKNHLKDNDFYRYDKYEKLTIALDDINPLALDKGILKKMPFLINQLEVNETGDKLILPLSVKEISSEVLYRKEPEKEKTIVNGIRSTGIDNLFHLGDMVDEVLQDVFSEVDIYDNSIYLLRKKFVSPIADGAISFYRYYIMDTTYVEKEKCFHLICTTKLTRFRFYGTSLCIGRLFIYCTTLHNESPQTYRSQLCREFLINTGLSKTAKRRMGINH